MMREVFGVCCACYAPLNCVAAGGSRNGKESDTGREREKKKEKEKEI